MRLPLSFATLSLCAGVLWADEPKLRVQASETLAKGIGFYTGTVSVNGTYLWAYSADLSKREGEGIASASEGWLQPPGTPSVGAALLYAYKATGEMAYLDAARETGRSLIRAQMRSGGWYYYIDFTEEGSRRKLAYRHVAESRTRRDISTLDDDVTQAVLRFMMRLDEALEFEDAAVRESVDYALESLFHAQHANGGWPQGYDADWSKREGSERAASYPDSWSREWPGSRDYWFSYTLNDNAMANTVETLLEAVRIYGRAPSETQLNALSRRCLAAAIRAGDFLILAQMPEPQPAWAQQYDLAMMPRWARRFEPPAISGLESQGAMRVLLLLSRETGEKRFLTPVGKALEYLKRSALPDGRLARFYELRTNRPLYFTTDYQLTYNDEDLPTHYGFKVGNGLARIESDFRALNNGSSESSSVGAIGTIVSDSEVRSIIEAQDERGRWVETGRLRYHPEEPAQPVIRSRTFVRHIEALSSYLSRQGEEE